VGVVKHTPYCATAHVQSSGRINNAQPRTLPQLTASFVVEMQGLILVSLLSVSLCASLDQEWHSWKSLHSKNYEDDDEEGARRLVWYDNYKKILEHNSANRSYSLALNQFADLVGSVSALIRTFLALNAESAGGVSSLLYENCQLISRLVLLR